MGFTNVGISQTRIYAKRGGCKVDGNFEVLNGAKNKMLKYEIDQLGDKQASSKFSQKRVLTLHK